MNAKKRALIKKADEHLSIAASIIENVLDQENDALDNMPENLQSSDRYSNMEEAIDSLDDALSSVDDSREYLSKVI